MCLVKIEKNSFYRKQLVTASGGVSLAPRFKDLTLSGGQTTDIEAGMNPIRYVVSGTVPDSMAVGGGKLVGGYFRTYASGISLSGSTALPVLEAYKVEDGISPTQGSYTFANRQVGTNKAVGEGLSFIVTCTTDSDTTLETSGANDTDNMYVGMAVSGSDLQPGTFITSITDGNSFVINQAATGGTADTDLTFYNVQRGNKLFVMSSYMDGDTPWLEENFDGADINLGQFQMLGDQGTATLSLKDAYLSAGNAARLIYQGGDNFGFGKSPEQISSNLAKYFSDPQNKNFIYIEPDNPKKFKGLWTSTNDRRTGKQVWSVYKPYWKWSTIKNHLQFKTETPATDDIDSAKSANTNNSIFGHIAVQSDVGNVFSASSEAPLLQSAVELSTEKKVSGGQALRFYHLWQYNSNFAITKKLEGTLGKRKINPQCSKACIYNIPEPPPALDMGAFNYNFVTGDSSNQTPASGANQSGSMASNEYPGLREGGHLTDKRLSFPEINLTMNITKLFPSPQIEARTSEGREMWGDKSWIYAYPPQANDWSGVDSGDRYMWTAKEIDSSSTPAYGYDSGSTDGVYSMAKGGLNTLLRSVAITFSNYKPDDYNTLDEFLAESLDDTYWLAGKDKTYQKNINTGSEWFRGTGNLGTGSVVSGGLTDGANTSAKIASGILFQTFRGASEYNLGLTNQYAADRDQDIDPDMIYCMALPMTRYNEYSSTGADGGTGLYASGGFAKFDNAGLTFAGYAGARGGTAGSDTGSTNNGLGGMTLVYDPRIGMQTLTGALSSTAKVDGDTGASVTDVGSTLPEYGQGVQGRPWGDSGSKEEPLWVAIPKDSWFTLKFVFDSQANAAFSKGPAGQKGGNMAGGVTYKCDETNLKEVSGGTYGWTNAPSNGEGDASKIKDYGLEDPSCQYGVPLRVYISGGVNAASGQPQTVKIGASSYKTIYPENTPYLNIPIPMRRSFIVSDDGTNYYRGNNDSIGNSAVGGIQTGFLPSTGDTFPFKYMTIWVNNYRHTTYQDTGTTGETVDYPFWRGNYFNGSTRGLDWDVTSSDTNAQPMAYRAADSKLFPSGLSSETEVFVDNIEFKHWNNEHVNHSIEGGSLSRFIKLEQSSVTTPVTTMWNTGTLYDDDLSHTAFSAQVAVGGTNTMTTMMKGFDPSGGFRTAQTGRFICFGVDDPMDLPFQYNVDTSANKTSLGNAGAVATSGADAYTEIQSGYFLWNNFTLTGDFGKLKRLSPDIAFVSTAPPTKPLNTGTNQALQSNQIGLVNYGGGFSATLGANVAGKNYAIFNPIISGGTNDNPTASIMRTKQVRNCDANDIIRFSNQNGSPPTGSYGWMIDNAGCYKATPSDDYPGLYSNCAAWSGAPSSSGATNDPAAGLYVAGQAYAYAPEEGQLYTNDSDTSASTQNWYPGFNWLRVEEGTTQVSTTMVSGSGGAVNMGSGASANWLSTDELTQKGYMKIDIDTVSNTGSGLGDTFGSAWSKWSKWAPRENILCSAKITGVPNTPGMQDAESGGGTATITVDDASIFNQFGDDRYVIFRIGESIAAEESLPNDDTTTFTPNLGGPALITNQSDSNVALGYHSMVKLSNIDAPINGSNITLTVIDSGASEPRFDGVMRADDGITDLCIAENLSQLWISPLKYWITLGFFDGGDLDIARSYENLCVINEIPNDGTNAGTGVVGTANFAGSTTNEFSYFYATGASTKAAKGESGLTINPWVLTPGPNDETTLDLLDYGYGDFDEETNRGGQVGIQSMLRERLNYMNIDGLASTKSTGNNKQTVDGANQPVVLSLGLSDETSPKKVTIYSDEYDATGADPNTTLFTDTVYKPTFIWRYHDALPEISNFTVRPTFNALEKDTNLYEMTTENLNSVTFNWNEKTDGDVWYRMLMVDDTPIENKYHNAVLWVPLNETGHTAGDLTDYSLINSQASDNAHPNNSMKRYWYVDPSTDYGRDVATSGSFLLSTQSGSMDVRQSIDGLSGFTANFVSGGTATYEVLQIQTATSPAANQTAGFYGLSEWTFVAHLTPAAGGNKSCIFYSQGDGGDTSGLAGSGGFDIGFDSNANVVARVSVTGASTAMTGTTKVADDGTPVSIIVTYGALGGLDEGQGPDLQLFVNGKREDYVTNHHGVKLDASRNIVIGADYARANQYKGQLEEIILYNKRYRVVPTENEYVMSTAGLDDTKGDGNAENNVTHNAKLFIFDYHNIRGKESTEVCSSSNIAWESTL